MKYIVSFINEDNNYLLLQASYSTSNDGNTSLHKVINDIVRGCMITRKFDLKYSKVLFTTNDNNEYILDNARSSEVTLILLKQLNESQLIESFANNVSDKKLYCYFLDHQNELMPKLLWTRCTSDRRTYLMATLYNFNSARYLFKWTISWIKNH